MEFALSLDRGTPQIVTGIDQQSVQDQAKAENPEAHVSVKKLITLANGVRMQVPNYISNSAFQKFYKDPEAYVTEYCLFNPPARWAQTIPMMFGSAFDGYVKNYLYERLYDETPPEFQLPQIIHDQCEPQFHDPTYSEIINGRLVKYDPDFDAFKWGKHLLDQYVASGTMQDLLRILKGAAEPPRFEFTVTDAFKNHAITQDKDDIDFVLLGKPDLYFKTANDEHIILDFKCNSINTSVNTSPKRGYIKSRDGWDPANGRKASRSNNKTHKDALPMKEAGIMCNFNDSFENVDRPWADQTTAYSWLMGTTIGGTVVAGIHQICGQKIMGTAMPDVLIAQHNYSVLKPYQFDLYAKYKHMWSCLQSGHIFHELSREESDHKVAAINAVFGQKPEPGSNEEWLQNSLRKQKYYG